MEKRLEKQWEERWGKLWEHELFKSYRAKFAADAEAKRILKKKLTKKYTRGMQTQELEKYILTATRELEQEKLFYYLLAKSNERPVLIIKSPADNASNKRFLGYEWSSRKGDEGIKYIGSATKSEGEDELSLSKGIDSIQTPLFNPRNLDDPSRINSLVRACFLGEAVSIPRELKSHCSTLRLTDMLDFKRPDWDAAIRTAVSSAMEIESLYPLKPLREFVDTLGGLWTGKKAPFVRAKVLRNTNFTSSGTLSLDNVAEIEVETAALAKRRLQAGDIIVEKSGGSSTQAVGRVVLFEERIQEEYAYSNFTVRLRVMTDILLPKYLHLYLHDFYLKGGTFGMQNGSSGLKNLNMESYLSVPIPLPPMEIQQAIVDECAVVDAEYESSRVAIDECRSKIGVIFLELDARMRGSGGIDTLLVDAICDFNPPKREVAEMPLDTVVSFIEMASVSNDGFVEVRQDRTLQEVKKGSYTYFRDGDIIIAKITPSMENGKCALVSGLTNGIGFGSSEFHVFRNKNTAVRQEYLFHYLNRDSIRRQAELRMTGASGHRRVPIDFYRELSIPVPSLQEQERIIRVIESNEAEIRKAEVVMQEGEARKSAILRKYLE